MESSASSFEIPERYGDNRIVMMVRDPWTLYAYWEISKEVEDSVREKMRREGAAVSKSILRIFEITGDGPEAGPRAVLDFELRDWANNWYAHAGEPGKSWIADLGILSTDGAFYTLARSNMVRTPVHDISAVCDEEWMCPEELYSGMTAALKDGDSGGSSLEAKGSINRHLKKILFGGGPSSGVFARFNFLKDMDEERS